MPIRCFVLSATTGIHPTEFRKDRKVESKVRVQAGLTLVETATAHNLPSVSKRICSTSDIVVLASTI